MIGANAPRMLAIALPHVDAWNTWYTHYGNTAGGLRAVRTPEITRAAERAGATRRRSSAARACSSRSSRRGERPRDVDAVPADRLRGSPPRARRGRRGRGDPRPRPDHGVVALASLSPSVRSHLWCRHSSRTSNSVSQRLSSASRSSARLAVRREERPRRPSRRRAAARARRRGPRRARPRPRRARARSASPSRAVSASRASASAARSGGRLRLGSARARSPPSRPGYETMRLVLDREHAARRPRRAARGRARRAGRCPGTPSSAASSASRDSRSRWFVGSSSTRKFAPDATAIASASRALAAREHGDRLLVLVPAREEEPAEQGLRLGPLQPGAAHRRVEHRAALVELRLVLREVRAASTPWPRRTLPARRCALAEDRLEQRRLARAVRADERDVLAALDRKRRSRRAVACRPPRSERPSTTTTSRPDRGGFRNSNPSVRRLSLVRRTERTASSFLICFSFDCACFAFDAL